MLREFYNQLSSYNSLAKNRGCNNYAQPNEVMDYDVGFQVGKAYNTLKFIRWKFHKLLMNQNLEIGP